jgi:hypothetical protein
MKKHYILNRPMFNRGGVSAYGKGIASNLVTEEQRQRFNYGGRVGLRNGGNWWDDIDYTSTRYKPIIPEYTGITSGGRFDYEEGDKAKWIYPKRADTFDLALENRAQLEQKNIPINLRKSADKLYNLDKTTDEAIAADWQTEGGETEVFDQDELEIARKRIEGKRDLASMPDSDTMKTIDWESILKPTPEQKRRTKGEAQLNLAAGALDVFSQPTVSKAMQAGSKHLLNIGKTASADQKARDKAILQGKVLSKVYTDRAGAKGEQDRLTAAAAKGVENTASNLFWGILDAAQIKKGKAKDVDYAYAYERASKKPTQIIKKEEDKAAIEANPEQFKDTVFVMGSSYLKLNEKTGRLEDITKEVLESFKG